MGEPAADAMVSLRMSDGGEASFPLRQVQGRQVAAAVPWRKARSARGQVHYPGYYWSATMGAHVICESRLELARLLLADFDPGVTAIAAQPFLLQARPDGRARRHVPDFLLVHADRQVQVVNVKPAGKLAEPRIAEALAWPGQLIEAHGWQYEIWSGADPVLLANLRFRAGYRRPGLLPGRLLDDVLAAVRPGDTIGDVISRMASADRRPGEVKAAVLRLLWQQRLKTGLSSRLDADSTLEVTP
jgi:TnsA endonuclease N terminal